MLPIITLKRRVKVEKYRGVLDIGRQNEKQSYLAVLKLAEENEGRITAQAIIEQFFKDRPLLLGERLILRCIYQGLFDDKGYITEEGKLALMENMVYVKERGAYDFWVTKDPLVPQKIIDLSSVYIDDNRGSKNLLTLPDWIKNYEGVKISLFSHNNEIIKIYNFEEKIQKMKNDMSITINYIIHPPENQEKSKLFLSGDINAQFTEMQPYPYDYIWYLLLGENQHRWDKSSESYKCHFNEVSDYSHGIFLMEKKFIEPKIDKLGSFNDIVIKNIAIKPINNEEANIWANWILEKKITDYLSNYDFEAVCNKIKSLKEFEDYAISFDSQNIFAKRFLKKSKDNEIEVLPGFWYLQAPLDLNPNNLLEGRDV